MKRALAAGLSFLFCVAAAGGAPAAPDGASRFTARISVGAGWLMSDEWFRDLHERDRAQRIERTGPDFVTLEDDYSHGRLLPEFACEFFCRVGPRFRVGIGAGYVRRTWNFIGRFERRSMIPEATAKYRVSRFYRAAILPVYLTGALEVLKSPAMALSITGAAGLDILGMKHVYERENSFFSPFDGEFKEFRERTTFEDGRAQSVELRVGLLGERRLTSGLGAFASVEFRLSPAGELYGRGVRESVFKSNGATIYDVREEVPRSSVNPGHRFLFSGPVLRAGLSLAF
ncbi:MAG: hypothetical protein PHX45_06450 [Acidobacteriota bacterium]|nr:hypothetical protein [Acidobacteriota bacterium]